MTLKEKIELAKKEVDQAELILGLRRRETTEWENLLDLRRETLASLELSEQAITKRKGGNNGKA